MAKQETSESKLSKRNLFLSIVRKLEGGDKIPIMENTLRKELEKTGRFTREEAEDWITKMHRESAIFEPKIGYYNRT